MARIRISIVIPAYNEARNLHACLDSIAKQTVRPYEVIVVDNNSADETAKIARGFAFVKVVNEKKQGIVFARNRGFDEAAGDIIARIDADSQLPPDWLRKISDFYQSTHYEGVAITGGVTFYNLRFARIGAWVQELLAFRMNRLLLGHFILSGANMAMPGSMWRAVRLHVCTRTDIHEDMDLSIHLHELGYRIAYKKNLRSFAKIRRVYSDRSALWRYLLLWPRTLRVHANRQWVIAWCGAAFLYLGLPTVVLNEKVAQFFGHDSLEE